VNQLDVAFYLKLDQMQNLVENVGRPASAWIFKLPDDINESILMSKTDYDKLCRRLKEL